MNKNGRVQGSTDMKLFKESLTKARRIVVITGAGVSAESGIPTFRGAGGFWRKYDSMKLATPQAFKRSPSLVWEFYHYRRELVFTKQPNLVNINLDVCYNCLKFYSGIDSRTKSLITLLSYTHSTFFYFL